MSQRYYMDQPGGSREELRQQVEGLVNLFFAHDQEVQGASLLAIADRYLSDLGSQQMKLGRDSGDPLVVVFGRGVSGVMLAGAHEKIKSLLTGQPESETTLRFTNGQWVRITQGHYAEFEGKITGYLNAKTLLVRLRSSPRPLAVLVDMLEGINPPER